MITAATRTYAVLGRPIAHSASPALHNAWFTQYEIDAVYVALEVKQGADDRFVSSLDTLGLQGANLTAPLKQRALPQVEAHEADAETVGAINTLFREGERWVGANTDIEGFCRAMEDEGAVMRGCDARIVGAGGAARAVAAGLAGRGADRIVILARRQEAACALAQTFSTRFPRVRFECAPIETSSLANADLCTIAVSGRPKALDHLDPSVMRASALWVDLNYWDPDPPGFLRARAAGLQVHDGHAMLSWQARLAFQKWTGILPQRGTPR